MKTEEMEKLFHELKRRFESGAISEEEFQSEMNDLFFKDTGGGYWTIGAKTEKWYRYADGDWVQASPPPTLERVAQDVRPPGVEQKPPPARRKRDYGNRIIMGLVSLLFLLCLIAVALASYQLGRLSVMTSPAEYTATPAAAMTQVPGTEATLPPEAGTAMASPTQPGPVDTPAPTSTQEEETSPTPATMPTPRPTSPPQPTATPMATPAMRYGPPRLVLPDDGAIFGPGYDAILEWGPVGELAQDEYYDVQVCWNNRSECTGQYQQGAGWTFPSYRRGSAVDHRYYWHVTVRLQTGDTRNGPSDPPISPESETWSFLLTR